MAKGMLIDTTRCTGCRGCQSACKQWNLLPGTATSFSPTMTNPSNLSEYNYNRVEFYELTDEADKLSWHFIQKRCLHCLEPECVESCPIGAIKLLPTGPVVVDRQECTGIQFCGCPFGVLRFEQNTELPRAVKCTFCWNRLEEGLEPACAKTCPSNCIEFGERDTLLAVAHYRIRRDPARYYPHVYGEYEAKGTSVMYLTAVSPYKLGLPNLPAEPPAEEGTPGETAGAKTPFPWAVPATITAIIATLGGLLAFRAKRTKSKSTAE